MNLEATTSNRLPAGQYSVYFAPITNQQLKFKISDTKFFLKVVSLVLHPSKCVYFNKIEISYYNKVQATSELKLINTISLSPSETLWLASPELNKHCDKFLHTPLKIYSTDSLTVIDKSPLNDIQNPKLYFNSYEWETFRSYILLITWIVKHQHKFSNEKLSIDKKKLKTIKLLHKIFYYFTIFNTNHTVESAISAERFHILTVFKIFCQYLLIDSKLVNSIIDTYDDHIKSFDFIATQRQIKQQSPHFYEFFMHISYYH